jgi:hypothetical protein
VAPERRSPAELAAGFVALAIGLLFEALIDQRLDAEALHASLFELISQAAVEQR